MGVVTHPKSQSHDQRLPAINSLVRNMPRLSGREAMLGLPRCFSELLRRSSVRLRTWSICSHMPRGIESTLVLRRVKRKRGARMPCNRGTSAYLPGERPRDVLLLASRRRLVVP